MASVPGSGNKFVDGCALCADVGGELIWQDRRLRVVLPDEALYPGFTRLIWHAHVRELTDLSTADRSYLFDCLAKAEQVMRNVLVPDKINLASLGNQVAHLHWHLIARWHDDAHFPAPVWASADPGKAAAAASRRVLVGERLADYRQSLRAVFER